MNRPIAGILFLALLDFGPGLASAQQRKGGRPARPAPAKVEAPDTSTDAAFDAKSLAKLAVLVSPESRSRNVLTNQQRLVEDEFVRVLIAKGYSVVSRSDLQSVMKEQGLQRSGVSAEDNAAKIGKLLNVPAVMVVRITESTAQPQHARASLGARLIGVENGSILWSGTHAQSQPVRVQGEITLVLAEVADTLAGAFPDKDKDSADAAPNAKAAKAPASRASADRSLDPKALPKLAVLLTDGRDRDVQTDQQRTVEDEFVQVLIRKGYSVASRSDLQAVIKEQGFQRSGLTAEDNAAKIGKILNVPAVMVVRITEFAVEDVPDPETRRRHPAARVSLGARLVGVESGLILWSGTHVESYPVSGQAAGLLALAETTKTIARSFPDRDASATAAKDAKTPAGNASADDSFDPRSLTRLAVIVVHDARRQNNQVDLPAVVEDEFVQVFIRKGYSLVSRSDIQAIAREKQFQKSGLTEENAAELGKLLNVPAVMVVRLTQSAVEPHTDPKTKRSYSLARATVGARLVSVESGLILWTGTRADSLAGGRGEVSHVVAQVSKALAGEFPDKNPAKAPAAKKAADPK